MALDLTLKFFQQQLRSQDQHGQSRYQLREAPAAAAGQERDNCVLWRWTHVPHTGGFQMTKEFATVLTQLDQAHPDSDATKDIKRRQLSEGRGGSEPAVRTSAWMWLLGLWCYYDVIACIG